MKAAGGGAPATVKRGRRADVVPRPVRVVEDRAQHRRRHAGEGHLLALDQAEDLGGVDGAQHDVRPAHSGERVDAAPAVAVEHRERPELDVLVADAEMGDQVVGVQVTVAVREHHALGARRRPRGVVERHDATLLARDEGRRLGGLGRDPGVEIGEFRGDRRARGGRRDPVADLREAGADLGECRGVGGVDDRDAHSRVAEDVLVVRRREAVVEGHEDRADLAGGVEALQEIVGVRGQDADPVALADAEREERPGQAVHPLAPLAVAVALRPVHDGGLVGVEVRGAAQEVVDQERNVHRHPDGGERSRPRRGREDI